MAKQIDELRNQRAAAVARLNDARAQAVGVMDVDRLDSLLTLQTAAQTIIARCDADIAAIEARAQAERDAERQAERQARALELVSDVLTSFRLYAAAQAALTKHIGSDTRVTLPPWGKVLAAEGSRASDVAANLRRYAAPVA